MHGAAARVAALLALLPFVVLAPRVPCCAGSIGGVVVIDASVGPAGVIRTVASPSSMARNMPGQHPSRPARNRRLALIRSPQRIDIDSLRLRFRICSPILVS